MAFSIFGFWGRQMSDSQSDIEGNSQTDKSDPSGARFLVAERAQLSEALKLAILLVSSRE